MSLLSMKSVSCPACAGLSLLAASLRIRIRNQNQKRFIAKNVYTYTRNLYMWQVAADHLFSISDDTLQSAPVFDGSSSVPDGDGGGEDGLYDGGVEVHHHGLWQVELFQLPQEVHPLLCLFGDAADVLLPLEVLADDCAQEAEGLRGVDWGVTQGDGVRVGLRSS